MDKISIIIALISVLEVSGSRFVSPEQVNKKYEDKPTSYILGGEVTERKKFPYLVALKRIQDDKHFCAGSILTTRVVLTAAHCVSEKQSAENNIKAESIYMEAGSNLENNDNTTIYLVESIKCHENFSDETVENDLAFLKSKEKIIFSLFVNALVIYQDDIIPGRFVTVIGWGCNEHNKQYKTSNELRYTNVQVIRKQRCIRLLPENRKRKKVTDNNFCTLDNMKGTCFGDSGGPALFDNKLVGIVSWGGDMLPDVYTILKFYEDWMTDYLRHGQ